MAVEDRLEAVKENFKSEVESMNELLNDPYKAPEQIVDALDDLLKAIWYFRVEYAAMVLANQRTASE